MDAGSSSAAQCMLVYGNFLVNIRSYICICLITGYYIESGNLINYGLAHM